MRSPSRGSPAMDGACSIQILGRADASAQDASAGIGAGWSLAGRTAMARTWSGSLPCCAGAGRARSSPATTSSSSPEVSQPQAQRTVIGGGTASERSVTGGSSIVSRGSGTARGHRPRGQAASRAEVRPRRSGRPRPARRGAAARARRRRSSRSPGARSWPPSGRARHADRGTLHGPDEGAIDDDDEAQDDRVAIAPPRGRMDEDRRAEDVPDHAVDDFDRVVVSPSSISHGAGPQGPVSEGRSPSSQTTKTSAWTGPSTSRPSANRTMGASYVASRSRRRLRQDRARSGGCGETGVARHRVGVERRRSLGVLPAGHERAWEAA